eukprot:gnl/TRDRNA2_/TRDRNA2_125261_c0_seq3.p3 gnl/TRDRNA2_/TRDRNA2_125261_c0~~gnl/TRDRNA2_/TRDRNA2_125261_c0_seq3.p3  ORF type:complete len:100 (+),score=12.66 gnl/TRDRNA2_/TRDRNA2_125261_c0_seq3:252-551(+)
MQESKAIVCSHRARRAQALRADPKLVTSTIDRGANTSIDSARLQHVALSQHLIALPTVTASGRRPILCSSDSSQMPCSHLASRAHSFTAILKLRMLDLM